MRKNRTNNYINNFKISNKNPKLINKIRNKLLLIKSRK